MNEREMDEIEPKQNRRQFLNRVWLYLGAAAGVQFGWFGISFLHARKTRNQAGKAATMVTAGRLDAFRPGTVTAIPAGQFYLACLVDGGLLALSRTCTHLGCSVPWDEEKQKFICPCHGSSFDLTGAVLTAPAPRPLDTYPVRIENGRVMVDISTASKRERFDPAQAVRL